MNILIQKKIIGIFSSLLVVVMIAMIVMVVLVTSAPVVYANKHVELVEWENPTPSLHEINLEISTLARIVGNGQLIISHKPKTIKLWSQGSVKEYQEVRFSSAMIKVDAPVDAVKKLVADTENYGSFMPQMRDSSIPLREGRHFMAHYTQQYNMGPFPLKAKFEWQHSWEKNGDLSILLHQGDIDAAVGRYEFFAINEQQSLLVLTTWQDLSTAKLTYRMMIKANPDFKAAFPAVAASILLLQYRDAFVETEQKEIDVNILPKQPAIPVLSENPEQLTTLIRLAEHGTLVLIGERIWYRDENKNNKAQDIIFASAVRTIPVPVEISKPYILDLSAIQEYTKEIKKVTLTDIENGKRMDAKLKIGLGVVGISLDFHFDLVEHSENARLILNGGGDMYPMLGAYEFSGFEKEGKAYTFGVLTQGGSIGEKAPYMVRLIAEKLPQFDFIRTIFSTLPQIEKQQAWIMEQLEKEKSI